MLRNILGFTLLSLGVLFLGFSVDRSQFWQVAFGFIAAFVGYAIVPKHTTLLRWMGLGLFLRIILVFSFPQLSDDIYRFIWDGLLVQHGLNPFAQLPAFYLESANAVPGLTPELFGLLNSPEYYTIYPPVAQLVFTFSTWVSPDSWYGAAVIMKVFLLLSEVGTMVLLYHLLPLFGQKREQLLWYWLNPLIIVEIVGNLHFEGMMIFFLLLSLWAFIHRRWWLSGLGFSLSVASKLLPLMFLPFLVVRLLWPSPRGKLQWPPMDGWKSAVQFGVGFTLSLLLCFYPLLSAGFLSGFGSSLDLYFRKFEFNASLYYLARAYGYYEIGWNQIARFGPLLARTAVGLILLIAVVDAIKYLRLGLRSRITHWICRTLRNLANDWCAPRFSEPLPTLPPRLAIDHAPSSADQYRSLPILFLFAFTVYLLCATTVHPWYLSIPIVMCCFGSFRFPLVWSFLITLTYLSYTTIPYTENLWIVAVEYLLTLTLLTVELFRFGQKPSLRARFTQPKEVIAV